MCQLVCWTSSKEILVSTSSPMTVKTAVIPKYPIAVEATTCTMKTPVTVETSTMAVIMEIEKNVRIDEWPVWIVVGNVIIIVRISAVVWVAVVVGYATSANHQ